MRKLAEEHLVCKIINFLNTMCYKLMLPNIMSPEVEMWKIIGNKVVDYCTALKIRYCSMKKYMISVSCRN